MTRTTHKEAGYKFIKYSGNKEAVFQDTESDNKPLEVWYSNPNHASYGFRFNNTDWEFIREYKPNG